MFATEKPEQGKGVLRFEIIDIHDINLLALERMGKLDPKVPASRMSFRLAFYSPSFDFENSPTIFSEEIEMLVDNQKKQLAADLNN